MVKKQRLDLFMVDNGLAPTRSSAQAMIMAGEVYVNGERAAKAGENVTEEVQVEVRSKSLQFVSRGGLKLDKAIKAFSLNLREKNCMDIGASTGGFTDCMLQNGAKKVYAIDVGYGQLAWKLRQDPRVINLERTNIRYVSREQVPEYIDFFSVDVSFISLKLVLPIAYQLITELGCGVCLIKPQFEAGKEKVGKKGVVRDPAVHQEVIERVVSFTQEIGFKIYGLDYSPVKGPEGNIEYLLYIGKNGENQIIDAEKVVKESHILDNKK